MAELKTKPTDASVEEFLDRIPDEARRQDCYTVLRMMEAASGAKAKLWGESIVGFGDMRYRYASGREGNWFLVGFSPRKQNLTLYLMYGMEKHRELLEQLGKHTIGKGCLYLKKLSDIDLPTLDTMIRKTVEEGRKAAA